jgi:hypothetical protein
MGEDRRPSPAVGGKSQPQTDDGLVGGLKLLVPGRDGADVVERLPGESPERLGEGGYRD